MSETSTGTVLRKRVSPPRPVRRADESQLEHILEIEMPRGADKLLALEVSVQAVTQTTSAAGEVVAALSETDMVSLMTSDVSGPGLIVVDPALLAAAIEVQTLGKVSAAPVTERTPTRVDMLIVSDLVDRWLTDISTAAEGMGCPEAIPFIDHVRAPRELSVRAVELMLEPVAYQSTRISLSMGGGAKTGTLTFVVPASGAEGRRSLGALGARLEPHVMDAAVVIDAVLDRVELSLESVLALAPGRVLPVSRSRIDDVWLEADGRRIDTARLGQFEGKRAVRRVGEGDALPMAVPTPPPALESASTATRDTLPALDPTPSDLPNLPDLPGSDTASDLPELPDLPEVPEPVDVSDLPELPDLPDLPDLPELPDLPGD